MSVNCNKHIEFYIGWFKYNILKSTKNQQTVIYILKLIQREGDLWLEWQRSGQIYWLYGRQRQRNVQNHRV